MSGETKAGPGKAQRKGRSAEGRATTKGDATTKGGAGGKGGAKDTTKGGAGGKGGAGVKGGAKDTGKGGAKTSKSRVGRYTPPDQSGRYTAATPRDVKRSPAWFGVLILALLILGVLMILLNYLGVLPASVTAWYLVGGLAMIFAGFLLATRYR